MANFRYTYSTALCLLFARAVASPYDEQLAQRVYAHIEIADYQAAYQEAQAAVAQQPSSKILREAYIRALAMAGQEKNMLSQWQQFIVDFPEERDNEKILECLAWSVIKAGACSSSPIIRVTALLGALFSKDAQGVALLKAGLADENALLRTAAIKLSSKLLDASLQEEMLRLFKSEPVWSVRLEAIKAVGELRIASARADLEAIIITDACHIEEKAAAVEALVALSDGIERVQAARLINSNRAGMRLLACELIGHFEQAQDADLLLPLIYDAHADVRAKVFQVLGTLRKEKVGDHDTWNLALAGTNDPDALVAVTAAWVLTLHDQQKGLAVFEKLFRNGSKETQCLTAAALAATGRYGIPLMRKIFAENKDPYIAMNLAMGLIGQRIDVVQASNCLYQGLAQHKEKWEWKRLGAFKTLMPSRAKHDEDIPNYPEAVNQLARLEILEVLAIVNHPQAQQAVKKFLQESHWGVSGLASALLLTEGDESAVELVASLLKDNDQQVRIQAALVLALWGNREDALQTLQQSYATADRDLKGQILEGIGRVGNKASRIFLAEKLQEPYQTLRIIAAASLLECLNH